MPVDIRIFIPPSAAVPRFGNVGLVTRAVEVTTVERLYTAGYFEIKIPTNAQHADRLSLGKLVRIDQGFWGIIDDLSYAGDTSGDFLTVTGRQLKGLMTDRITIPPDCTTVTGAQGYDTIIGSTETCMKHYVAANFANPLQLTRQLYGLEILPDLGRGMAGDKYMSRHEILGDVLLALGEGAALGYDLVPDLEGQRFVFDVVAGTDHTARQSDRMRVIFSLDRQTASSQTYRHATGDSRNVFYTTLDGAEFADEALTVTYLRENETEAQGIFRREKHLSISASTPIAGEEYQELRRKALLSAEEFRAAESFDCEILLDKYVYRRDFFLGDLVTVQNKGWGVTMDARVTEVKSAWSSAGVSVSATLGTAPLGVFGRLRRQLAKGT